MSEHAGRDRRPRPSAAQAPADGPLRAGERSDQREQ